MRYIIGAAPDGPVRARFGSGLAVANSVVSDYLADLRQTDYKSASIKTIYRI